MPKKFIDRQEWRILIDNTPSPVIYDHYPTQPWGLASWLADVFHHDAELQTRFVNNDPRFEQDIDAGTYSKDANGTVVTHWQFLQCNSKHS